MRVAGVILTVAGLCLAACGSPSPTWSAGTPSKSGSPSAAASLAPPSTPGPVVGNPNGRAVVPAEAQAVDTSSSSRVIGDGTPASCTSEAVVTAVAAGGIITFACGPEPVTITMAATAKVRNANGPRIVLDGGGKVTLSGEGKRRILYMNTCDKAQGWTTSHCQDQDHPQLTVQNLTFADGNSTGDTTEGGGGGAINNVSNDRSGTMSIDNSTLRRNKSGQFETRGFPGIFFLGAKNPSVTGSTLS